MERSVAKMEMAAPVEAWSEWMEAVPGDQRPVVAARKQVEERLALAVTATERQGALVRVAPVVLETAQEEEEEEGTEEEGTTEAVEAAGARSAQAAAAGQAFPQEQTRSIHRGLRRATDRSQSLSAESMLSHLSRIQYFRLAALTTMFQVPLYSTR